MTAPPNMRLYPSPYAGSAFAAADPTAADTLPPQLAGAARCEFAFVHPLPAQPAAAMPLL